MTFMHTCVTFLRLHSVIFSCHIRFGKFLTRQSRIPLSVSYFLNKSLEKIVTAGAPGPRRVLRHIRICTQKPIKLRGRVVNTPASHLGCPGLNLASKSGYPN
jgi:hypothetical protein